MVRSEAQLPRPDRAAPSRHDQVSYGQLVEAFEEIARQNDPFALYPIIRIWPKP